MTDSPYRALPSVDALLNDSGVNALIEEFSREHVAEVAREVISEARLSITNSGFAPRPEDIARQVVDRVNTTWSGWPTPVINATGVVIHTNLGRAPMSDALVTAALRSSSSYSDLEFDIQSGKRGSRNAHISRLIAQISGAEAGIAVNNNASGVLLTLAALAGANPERNEVVISRGEAVEIGGGFRIPDVMRQSGAVLVEVGTTNRTYARDYEDAITPRTAAILKVHPSNFTVEGFTHTAELSELADVARRNGVALINDLGSGCLVDTRKYGLEHEPTVQESATSGANITLFSGDKLLGGPQAGLIAGDEDLVAKISKHPLARAVRIDKLTLAAIAETLITYIRGNHESNIPIWGMISSSESSIANRAQKWRDQIGRGEVQRTRSAIGGGSLPGQTIPSTSLVLMPSKSADDLASALRNAPQHVIARIEDGQVIIDPRTVLPEQDVLVSQALVAHKELVSE
jgi:L-seryl-tRNA(Ser) seleniumtransferase